MSKRKSSNPGTPVKKPGKKLKEKSESSDDSENDTIIDEGSSEINPRSGNSQERDVDAHRSQEDNQDVPLCSPNQSQIRSSERSPRSSTSREYQDQHTPDVDAHGGQEVHEDISPVHPPHQSQRSIARRYCLMTRGSSERSPRSSTSREHDASKMHESSSESAQHTPPSLLQLYEYYINITRKQCKFALQDYVAFRELININRVWSVFLDNATIDPIIDGVNIFTWIIKLFLLDNDEKDIYIPQVQQMEEDFKSPPRYLLINPVPSCQDIIQEDTVKGIPIVTRHDTYEEALAASRKHTRFGIATLPETVSEADETDIEINVYDNICTEKESLLKNKPEDVDIPALQQSPERQFLLSFKLPRAQVQDPRIENSSLDYLAEEYVKTMSKKEEKCVPIDLNYSMLFLLHKWTDILREEKVRGEWVISCQKILIGIQCFYKCTVNMPHIEKTYVGTHRSKTGAIQVAFAYALDALKAIMRYPHFSHNNNQFGPLTLYFHIGRIGEGESNDDEIVDEAELKRRFRDRVIAIYTKHKLNPHEEDHRSAADTSKSISVFERCDNAHIDSQSTEILESIKALDRNKFIHAYYTKQTYKSESDQESPVKSSIINIWCEVIFDPNFVEWVKNLARKMEPIIQEMNLDNTEKYIILHILHRIKNKSLRGKLLATFEKHMLLPENIKERQGYNNLILTCIRCKKTVSQIYDDYVHVLICRLCYFPAIYHACSGEFQTVSAREGLKNFKCSQCPNIPPDHLRYLPSMSALESSPSPSTSQESVASTLHEGSRSSTPREHDTDAHGTQVDNKDVLSAYSPGQSQRGSPENSPRSGNSQEQDVDAHRSKEGKEDVSPLYSPNQSPRRSSERSPKPSTSQEYDASKMHEEAQEDQLIPDVDAHGSQVDNEDQSSSYPPQHSQRRSQNVVDVEEGVGGEQNPKEINKGQESGN